MPSWRTVPRTFSRALSPRGDEGVGEVMGSVLLTAITLVLATGFGLVVFSGMTGTEEPTPSAAFSVDARPGLAHVNVSFREGTSFDVADARLSLLRNGAPLDAGYLISPAAAGRFTAGDLMRFNLTSGVVTAGDAYTFLAADLDGSRLIGHGTVTVPGSGSGTAYAASAVSLSQLSFSPATISADGTNTTTVRVSVGSSAGLALVRSVTADLREVGGGTLELRDDGMEGDEVASDGIYAGTFAASQSALDGASTATATIPVVVEDVFGKTASLGSGTLAMTASDTSELDALEARLSGLITNSTSATNIIGVGGVSRNLPSSTRVDELYVTNFTWRDVADLPRDLIIYRVTDIADYTRTWVVYIYLDDCAAPYGAVERVVMYRDGVAGSAEWTPPGGCFSLDGPSQLHLIDLNDSIDASGATRTWTFTGDPTTFSYPASGITAFNQGIVPFFADASGGGTPEMGLGFAALEWTYLPNRAPVPGLSVSVTGERAVSATAAASVDPDGDALTYTWLWGDGTSSTGLTATHTYATAAEHTLTLQASDGNGGIGSIAAVVGQAPTAVFNSTVRGLTAYASAAGSTDPSGLALSHLWAWGDGATSTGETASRTYAANATHTVNLTVTNLFGTSGYATAPLLHDGTLAPFCGPLATAWGSVAGCASLASATDSGASMSVTETANGTRRQAYVVLNVTGFAETDLVHTLEARARHVSGSPAEALALQVLDASSGSWSTPAGFSWSSATASTATHALTAGQWNSGLLTLRLVDANCASSAYNCTAADTVTSQWAVDWVRVVSS